MKSIFVTGGGGGFAEEWNALRSDAFGSGQLQAHQQYGSITLPTNPSNTQTLTLDINGTNVVLTFVTSIGATAGNILIGASAAATAQNIGILLQNSGTTTSTGVALSSANQVLVQYLGWMLSGTTITPYSLNTTTYAPATSFSASTTATGGGYSASTMKLCVEPGTYFIGITKVIYAGGNTSAFTAPSSHPRIDIVTLDSSGTLAVTTGTEASSPVAPTYPANKLVLCEVTHSVGETSIFDNANQTSGQGFISNDSRVFLAPPYISDPSQVATQIFIPWISSIAQGDVIFVNNTPAWTRLGAGTAGQVLTTQGASANPTWSTPTAGYHGAGTANGTNYQTSSTTFVDVDGTNLKVTLSGLTSGQFVAIRLAGQANNSGTSTTNGLQFIDLTNSAVIFAQTLTSGTAAFSFDGLYKCPSSGSITFSLQYKTTTGACVVLNQNTAWLLSSAGAQVAAFVIQPLN